MAKTGPNPSTYQGLTSEQIQRRKEYHLMRRRAAEGDEAEQRVAETARELSVALAQHVVNVIEGMPARYSAEIAGKLGVDTGAVSVVLEQLQRNIRTEIVEGSNEVIDSAGEAIEKRNRAKRTVSTGRKRS